MFSKNTALFCPSQLFSFYWSVSRMAFFILFSSFEGRIWRTITSRSEGPSKRTPKTRPSFLSFWRMLSFTASHIPRFSACPKKEERKKTSGTVTRKCSKGDTVPFNNGWCGQQGLSEGEGGHKGRVLWRMRTLNWDTALESPLHSKHWDYCFAATI